MSLKVFWNKENENTQDNDKFLIFSWLNIWFSSIVDSICLYYIRAHHFGAHKLKVTRPLSTKMSHRCYVKFRYLYYWRIIIIYRVIILMAGKLLTIYNSSYSSWSPGSGLEYTVYHPTWIQRRLGNYDDSRFQENQLTMV